MRYIKTYELFGFKSRRYSKSLSKLADYFASEGGQSIKEVFYDLEDDGIKVDLISGDIIKYIPLSIGLSKYDETTFDLTDDISDAIFSGISRIEDKLDLKFDFLTVHNKHPRTALPQQPITRISSEKEWNKKFRQPPVYTVLDNGDIKFNEPKRDNNSKNVANIYIYFK